MAKNTKILKRLKLPKFCGFYCQVLKECAYTGRRSLGDDDSSNSHGLGSPHKFLAPIKI